MTDRAVEPPFLDEVFEAHGGRELWTRATRVEARVSTGGLAFLAHFRGDPLANADVQIHLDEQRVRLDPYPHQGCVGHFDCRSDRVEIEDLASGNRRQRSSPRPPFFGLRRRIWWDDLDALYFCGYALWNYLSFPRLLLRLDLRELEPWREGGEPRRRLAARFPEDLSTHCREQVFHFDERHLLRRHDYTAEVIGGWAHAGHYCDDHRDFGAGIFPTRRSVYPRKRDDTTRPFPRLVWIQVHEAQLHG